MPREVEFLPFECEVLHETEMAFKLLIEGEDEKWVPKSVIEPPHFDIEVGAISTEIGIAEWWAKKEGLL